MNLSFDEPISFKHGRVMCKLAGTDLEGREIVRDVDGDLVFPTESLKDMTGIVAHPAKSGDEVVVIGKGSEVNVWANESITAGEWVKPHDQMTFEGSDAPTDLVAMENASEGELFALSIS